MALASSIVTVSALASSSSHISVQNTAPGTPSLNDLWINDSVITAPLTFKWDGIAWIPVTTPITVAALSTEAEVRAAADGNLSVNYSLVAIAGGVITGMQINSSVSGGVPTKVASSSRPRRAALILWSVSVAISAGEKFVNLADTLTVSTSGMVFIGAGAMTIGDRILYVDPTGKFSLENADLGWDDPQHLRERPAPPTITTPSSRTSRPREFKWRNCRHASPGIDRRTLPREHPSRLLFRRQLVDLHGFVGNFYLGGTSGSLQWNAGTSVLRISGSLYSSFGMIGGWTIKATTISENVALDSSGIITQNGGKILTTLSAVNGTYALWIGNTAPNSSPFHVTIGGMMSATNAVLTGTTMSGSTYSTARVTMPTINGTGYVGAGGSGFPSVGLQLIGQGSGNDMEFLNKSPRYGFGSLPERLTRFLQESPTISGPLSVTDPTDTTTVGTGCVVLSGGLSIAKTLFIGANIQIMGTVISFSGLSLTSGALIPGNYFTIYIGGSAVNVLCCEGLTLRSIWRV